MIKKEDAILIAYPPGGYGHYIYWILNNFSSVGSGNDFTLPFDQFGGSHNQDNSGITKPSDLATMKECKYAFLHCHIDTNFHSEYLEQIVTSFKKYIIINDDTNSNDFYLQMLNNFFDKAAKQDLRKYVRGIKNCENFEIPETRSEAREYLSYKVFHRINWINLNSFKNPDAIRLSVGDLLYNFDFFLDTISEFIGATINNRDFLIKNHEKFISLQNHLTKDHDVNYFLSCFENNIDTTLPPNLSIIDEAYIQHYLRESLNLEIKCFGLEVFPETTTELHKITYPAEELNRLE